MLSLSVVPPVTPTPVDEIAEALDRIGPLHACRLRIGCGWHATARR
jgi:hypothetical protein